MTRRSKVSAAAAVLGRKGGKAKTEKKAAAVRENGRKGGRPMRGAELLAEPPVRSWLVPPELQGQMVERSYGTDEEGEAYERTEDRAEQAVTYRHLGHSNDFASWDPANTKPSRR